MQPGVWVGVGDVDAGGCGGAVMDLRQAPEAVVAVVAVVADGRRSVADGAGERIAVGGPFVNDPAGDVVLDRPGQPRAIRIRVVVPSSLVVVTWPV